MPVAEEEIISWEASEGGGTGRGPLWYWISICVSAVLIAFAVWQRNYLFAAFIIIAELVVLIAGGQPPQTFRFAVDANGLAINNRKRYPWSEIENFSIHGDVGDERQYLVVRLRNRFQPSFRISASVNEIARIRAAFRKRVPEVEAEPSLLSALEELLRF